MHVPELVPGRADLLSVDEVQPGAVVLEEADEGAEAGPREGPILGLPSAALASILGPCARSHWC